MRGLLRGGGRFARAEAFPKTYIMISAGYAGGWIASGTRLSAVSAEDSVLLAEYIEIYNKRKDDVVTITDAISLMVPYTIGYIILWLVIVLGFYIIGVPIGPGVGVML